jgi:heat shock protein HslJ
VTGNHLRVPIVSMGMRWVAVVFAGALMLLVVACGDDGETVGSEGSTTDPPGTSEPTGDLGPLAGRTFVSTTVTHDLVDGTRIRMSFVDGEVRAHAGCNHLLGDASVDDDRLVVSGVGGTEMGCDAALHAQDEWLAAFLEGDVTFSLDADTFMLFDGTDRIAMVDREIAEPDRTLTDVLWVVSSIVDGDSVSSVPGSPEVEASMTFAGGQVQGTDGCNTFGGPAEVGDGSITFGALRMTRMACTGDEGALAEAVAPLLQGTVEYEIESDQLTLTADSGRGLVLRARD